MSASHRRWSDVVSTQCARCMRCVFRVHCIIYNIFAPLKRQIQIAADDILMFLLLSFEENEA